MKTDEKPRKVTKKERNELSQLAPDEFIDFEEEVEFEQLKVEGVQKCNVCQYPQKDKFVICPICYNCQYCGGKSKNSYLNRCDWCGNEIANEAKIPIIHINI